MIKPATLHELEVAARRLHDWMEAEDDNFPAGGAWEEHPYRGDSGHLHRKDTKLVAAHVLQEMREADDAR